MKNIKQIIEEMTFELLGYYSDLQKDNDLSYFVFNVSFFEKYDLSYKTIFIEEIDINEFDDKSKKYFNINNDEEKAPKINRKNENELEISVENIKRYTENESNIGTYKHIYEYIIFDILNSFDNKNNIILKQQKHNFIYEYIKFLERKKTPIVPDNFKNTEDDNKYIKLGRNLIFLKKKKNVFINLLNEMHESDTEIRYRGHANSIWKLKSSLHRTESYKTHENIIFHELISLKPEAFIKDKTTYEKLITMQHYGLPTRLLDITRNPLIAIFFACDFSISKENINSDGKILIFNSNEKLEKYNYSSDIIQKIEDKFNNNNDINDIFYLSGIATNPRITNQCGDFIFVGDGDHEETLENLPIKEIIIDSSLKDDILKELELFNIHAGTVYPDLSNMTAYLKYKYKDDK